MSLNGTMGHNIALDELVEMCIVQPMKNYSTGYQAVHNTVFENNFTVLVRTPA